MTPVVFSSFVHEQESGGERTNAMNVRGELLELPNGGHIAYDEYGDPTGLPVLFCHGWPSSRTMAQLTDAAARELGVPNHFAGSPGHQRLGLRSGAEAGGLAGGR
jgi:hypothetical protein